MRLDSRQHGFHATIRRSRRDDNDYFSFGHFYIIILGLKVGKKDKGEKVIFNLIKNASTGSA
jgi:hypothetical protein